MADREFSEEFLRGLEARDFDVDLVAQLANLTSEQLKLRRMAPQGHCKCVTGRSF